MLCLLCKEIIEKVLNMLYHILSFKNKQKQTCTRTMDLGSNLAGIATI